MNLVKLGKRLRREAAANPKKAALLGVATVVAVYFWTPLVWGWIGKSDPNMTIETVNAVPTPTVGVTASVAPTSQPTAKANGHERPSWPQIVQWIHNDPRIMTAPSLTKTRDPFETPTIEVATPRPAEQPRPKPPAIAPSAAGLALTSTIIGPQRRIAQINGKTYAVGQTVEMVKEKEAGSAAFKLVEVQPRRAVLEADGQRFELLIPEPGKSDKIELK